LLSVSQSRHDISRRTYRIPTNVEVEGSDLPIVETILLSTRGTMSSPPLVVLQEGTMTIRAMSGSKRTNTLSMSGVVEDAGESSGHVDDGRVMGKYQ